MVRVVTRAGRQVVEAEPIMPIPVRLVLDCIHLLDDSADPDALRVMRELWVRVEGVERLRERADLHAGVG